MKRRMMRTVALGLAVLVATATGTLAFGLLFDSNAPFERAFATRHGSEVTTTSKATPAQLAATTGLAGVTAAAGPFPRPRSPRPCSRHRLANPAFPSQRSR
jgi:putative ABC transport system permease protein